MAQDPALDTPADGVMDSLGNVLYLDCFAGASGDMVVGALLDLGVPLDELARVLAGLPLDGYRIDAVPVVKNGIRATRFRVILEGGVEEPAADWKGAAGHGHAPDHGAPHGEPGAHRHAPHPGAHPHRRLADILRLIDQSALSPRVKATAARIFRRLGEAEAAVHGVPLDQVHFHEVGSTDAIVDVVAAAAALDLLEVEAVYASPLHVGSGFVRCAHGLFPVPAPATALLLRGVPTYATHIAGELVTPTGAAILTAVCRAFGPQPPLVVERVGHGAGQRDREIPNVLRAYLGRLYAPPASAPAAPTSGDVPASAAPAAEPGQASSTPAAEAGRVGGAPGAGAGPAGDLIEDRAVLLETNLDDMNPQFYGYLFERLLAAGALDVWVTPVQMKKGRPGAMLAALAPPDREAALVDLLLRETTTLGVRRIPVDRRILPRETLPVQTPAGVVRVKVARRGGQVWNLAPEYDDCLDLARRTGRPLKEIHDQARAAAWRLVGGGEAP